MPSITSMHLPLLCLNKVSTHHFMFLSQCFLCIYMHICGPANNVCFFNISDMVDFICIYHVICYMLYVNILLQPINLSLSVFKIDLFFSFFAPLRSFPQYEYPKTIGPFSY